MIKRNLKKSMISVLSRRNVETNIISLQLMQKSTIMSLERLPRGVARRSNFLVNLPMLLDALL